MTDCRKQIVHTGIKYLMTIAELEFEYTHCPSSLAQIQKLKKIITDCIDEHVANSYEFWNHIENRSGGEFSLHMKDSQ